MVGRVAVVLVAALAFALALIPMRACLLVSYAWAGLGASFGPLVLATLYARRIDAPSALASMLIGGATVVGWGALEGGLFDLYEIIPGFLAASTVLRQRSPRTLTGASPQSPSTCCHSAVWRRRTSTKRRRAPSMTAFSSASGAATRCAARSVLIAECQRTASASTAAQGIPAP